jgi:hypothetical protein
VEAPGLTPGPDGVKITLRIWVAERWMISKLSMSTFASPFQSEM